MSQNEFYRQIAEQTGEDYHFIEQMGFIPVMPRYRNYPRQRRRRRIREKAFTSTATSLEPGKVQP